MTKIVFGIIFVALLNGCAGLEVNREVKQGREALLSGAPHIAVGHFERAAALNGAVSSPPLYEGPWTFVGRAYYHAMKYPEARQALRRSLAQDDRDTMARLYYAMIGGRETMDNGSREEIHVALLGLKDQIDYIIYRTSRGRFWDPSGKLRAEFNSSLEAIATDTPDWDTTLARIGDLALSVEAEIDQARKDELRSSRRTARD